MSFRINSPLPSSLASECQKAARILNGFIDPGQGIDKAIPPGVLARAKGLAIFTVLKAGFLFSGRAGSGLVIARLPDGSWSAPAAIITGGMGVGGQVGAELTDFVMVLNTTAAVKTFMHHGSITLGGNVSVAAGPVGRNMEASGTASIKNVSAIYSYSKTRGLFAGVSLEGSVILERFDANAKMYGRKIPVRELLNGTVPPPPQAEALYRALNARASGGSNARFSFMNHNGSYTDTFSGSNGADFGTQALGRSSSSMYNTEPAYGDQSNDNDKPSSFSRGVIHREATGNGNLSLYTSTHSPRYSDTYTSSYRNPYDTMPTPPPEHQSMEPRVRALFNFAGEQEGDLSFKKGDIITLVEKTHDEWWTGTIGTRKGIFPANFVEEL